MSEKELLEPEIQEVRESRPEELTAAFALGLARGKLGLAQHFIETGSHFQARKAMQAAITFIEHAMKEEE